MDIQTPPAGSRTIDFLALPIGAREAFARAINENRAPLARRSGPLYALSAFAGAALLAVLIAWGFGGHDAGLVAQSPVLIAGYALAFAGLVGGVLLYRRRTALTRLLGCAPGVYALGSRLIDARARELRLYDLFASEPSIVHRYVNGGYRNTSLTWHGFVFWFGHQDRARQALSTLNMQLHVFREATSANNLARMLVVDPLTVGLALGNRDGATPAPQVKSRRPLVLAAVAALGLAVPTWYARNAASLAAAFEHIRSARDADFWIAQGGDPERGYRKKMEIELTWFDAEDAGKLRDLLARYPDAPDELKRPAQEALANRYHRARAAALALSSSEPLTAFIKQVYATLESNGVAAVMQIEVARTDNSALTAFDEEIAADPVRGARVAPVARYFAASEDAARTRALKQAVQSGLGQFFPPDIMVFSDTAVDNEARITIFYVVRLQISNAGLMMYRRVDAQDNPIPGSLAYPGIEFELGATLEVPGVKQPQRVVFTAQPAPIIDVEHSSETSGIYGAMAASAFADLQGKLVRALGGKPALDDAADVPCDFGQAYAKLDACHRVTAADRERLVTDLLAGTDLDDRAFCTRGSALIHQALVRASCAH